MPKMEWYSWIVALFFVLLVAWFVYEFYTAPEMEEYDKYERQLSEEFDELDKQKRHVDNI